MGESRANTEASLQIKIMRECHEEREEFVSAAACEEAQQTLIHFL